MGSTTRQTCSLTDRVCSEFDQGHEVASTFVMQKTIPGAGSADLHANLARALLPSAELPRNIEELRLAAWGCLKLVLGNGTW